MDPEPWGLLHDGIVIAVERTASDAMLTVAARHLTPHLGRGDVSLRLGGVEELVYRPYGERGDDPDVVDPAAIARAKLTIVDAVVESGALIVWGSMGSLRIVYRSLSLEIEGRPLEVETLALAVRAFWDDWRMRQSLEGAHPLVRTALLGEWSAALRPALLEAWQRERTSDLADVLEALDDAMRPEVLAPPETPDALAGWRHELDRARAPSLDQLVRCAFATFGALADEEDRYRAEGRLGAWLDARFAAREAWWQALTGAVATLLEEPPDPAIGRTMVAMLRSPSDHWFRTDQVAHVVGTIEGEGSAPSFADHALLLIERHADAGTPERLEEEARAVSIEADCNGAQMADDLRALAAVLRARHPVDRTIDEPTRMALSRRALSA